MKITRSGFLRKAMFALPLAGLAACATTEKVTVEMPPPPPSAVLDDFNNELASVDTHQIENDARSAEAVRRHVQKLLSQGVIDEYELFIYINKAAEGPMAQHAYLFERESGELKFLDAWLVSTGREKQETSPKGLSKFTATPTGTFMFDTGAFQRLHKSDAWEADMPWAMFLRTRNGGPTSGIAMHAALDKYVHNLGQRASAGCIRLLPSNAEKLYKLLLGKYAGSARRLTPSGVGASLGGGSISGTKALVIVEQADGQAILDGYDTGPALTN